MNKKQAGKPKVRSTYFSFYDSDLQQNHTELEANITSVDPLTNTKEGAHKSLSTEKSKKAMVSLSLLHILQSKPLRSGPKKAKSTSFRQNRRNWE
jgi:hypothetical protein